MRMTLTRVSAFAVAAAVLIGDLQTRDTHAAAPTPTAVPAPSPALAYAANGQVVVIEAGSLTVAGPGQNPAWSPSGANLMFDIPDLLSNTATIYLADKHGANTRPLLTKAYPAINPTWSPDSKYVVYTAPVPGTPLTGHTVKLLVKAIRIGDGATRTLAQFTFTAGCSALTSALQDTFTKAQGSYHGTPSTLIWAQPSRIAVQSSCTGQGITLFNVGGGGLQSLPAWSGGVLSPDGKSIVAAVAGAGHAAGRVGVIAVGTGTTKVLGAKISPTIFAWGSSSKVLFAIAQPANPATGFVTIYRMSPDGKVVGALGQARASGAFHLSVSHLQDHLAMAVVSSTPRAAMSAPTVFIADEPSMVFGAPAPFVPGVQPAWRP